MIRTQNKSTPTPDPTTLPPSEKVQAGLAAVLQAQTNPEDRGKRRKPYYSQEYANEAKILLERLHTTRIPIRIHRDVYSLTTRLLQWYQGAEYLRDDDPTNRYESLFRATKCTKHPDYIELHIRNIAKPLSELATNVAPWRDKLYNFVDTATEGDKFHRTDVLLSEDNIIEINNMLIPLANLFMFRASANEILVIRHTEQVTT